MTIDQLSASLDAFDAKLDEKFGAIETELRLINKRLDHMPTRADVFTSVLQAIGLVVAATIGTFVVLNAIGVLG